MEWIDHEWMSAAKFDLGVTYFDDCRTAFERIEINVIVNEAKILVERHAWSSSGVHERLNFHAEIIAILDMYPAPLPSHTLRMRAGERFIAHFFCTSPGTSCFGCGCEFRAVHFPAGTRLGDFGHGSDPTPHYDEGPLLLRWHRGQRVPLCHDCNCRMR